MALSPKAKKLVLDVDDSAEPADQIKSLIDQLHKQLTPFLGDVHAALDKGLTGENLQRQTQTLTIQTNGSGAPAAAVKFDCTLPSRPSSVRPAQIRVLSGSAPTAAVDTTHWALTGTGKTIEFQSLPGLAANSKYELTVFVE